MICSTKSGFWPNDQSPCWRPGTASELSTSTSGFYSPGLQCLSGYTSACRATAGGYSEWTPVFPLTEHETAWGCCPSSFTCFDLSLGVTQSCTQRVSETEMTGVLCGRDQSSTITISLPHTYTSTILLGTETQVSVTTDEVIYLSAPLIRIVWQSSDKYTRLAPSSTASVSNTTTSSGLSKGAKAGIGVGAGVGGTTILGVAALLILRYRRKKSTGKENNPLEQDMNVTSQPDPAPLTEIGSRIISQLGDEGLKFEMPVTDVNKSPPAAEGRQTEEPGQSQGRITQQYHELAS
ncbi:hypothetical protein GGR57DRAFT_508842 [Xylariaceae sp. FL1272]|nr:hypothetical protein GGR57DRAFT_508842 [Xylariaceae sp. FL1272]